MVLPNIVTKESTFLCVTNYANYFEYLADRSGHHIWFPISCNSVVEAYHGEAILVYLR